MRVRWRLWALLILAALLAWFALQRAPSPEVSVVAPMRPGPRLPSIAPPPRPVDPAPALAALSQSTLWGPLPPRPGSGASGPDAGTVSPKWTVSGYYEQGGTRFIVVSFEQLLRPSQHLKLGDKLPDGSRIVKIEPDRVRAQPAAVTAPEEGAATPSSGWLPITPGLPEITSNRTR